MIQAFPAIALPATAYRRTFLARALAPFASPFARLLMQLAPEQYARMRDRSPMACYYVLLDQVNTMFPTWQPEFVDWGEILFDNADEAERNAEWNALQMGIPLDVFGLEWTEMELEESTGLVVSALIVLAGERAIDSDPDAYRALKPLRAALAGYSMRLAKNFDVPPRRREWRAPWDALGGLVAYVQSQTGYVWLDYSPMAFEEDGYCHPQWDLDEIRSLAQMWTQAQSVWKRIKRLVDYVDAKPAVRAPLLAGALCDDEAARQRISRPKPARLVEVLR